MPVNPVLTDAKKLLIRNGHDVTEVLDVDAEGPVCVIAYRHGPKAKTAFVSLSAKGKELVTIRDDWVVP